VTEAPSPGEKAPAPAAEAGSGGGSSCECIPQHRACMAPDTHPMLGHALDTHTPHSHYSLSLKRILWADGVIFTSVPAPFTDELVNGAAVDESEGINIHFPLSHLGSSISFQAWWQVSLRNAGERGAGGGETRNERDHMTNDDRHRRDQRLHEPHMTKIDARLTKRRV